MALVLGKGALYRKSISIDVSGREAFISIFRTNILYFWTLFFNG